MVKTCLFRAKRIPNREWVFGDLLRFEEKVYIHNGIPVYGNVPQIMMTK